MKVLVTLKVHEGSILRCTVTNTSPLGRKWIERHLGSTLFLSVFFYLFLAEQLSQERPAWCLQELPLSLCSLYSFFYLLKMWEVFVLLLFFFLFQVQGRVPFAFCSGKLKIVTCCKSVCLNRHSWSCVWKCVWRIYETCGDVGSISDKNPCNKLWRCFTGMTCPGWVTGYLSAILLNDRPIVNNSKGSEPEFCLLNIIIVALSLILIN